MLNRIMFAGPDDLTDIQSLLNLSSYFPYVEWGILYSPNKNGTSRYPGNTWRQEFESKCHGSKILRSLHLCGEGVKQFQRKELDNQLLSSYQRIQLNMNSQTSYWKNKDNILELLDSCQKSYFYDGSLTNIIIQHNHNNIDLIPEFQILGTQLNILYDASGGHAKDITNYLPPFPENYTGYAGGIGPDNCVIHANNLLSKYENIPYWLDMESKIRTTDDKWDHDKVLTVINLLKPFII